MITVVVLDDYQQAAASSGPWERLTGVADISFEQRHLTGDELVARLSGAEVVVAMRERTPFPAALFDRLPNLRLLVTTGMANASIDFAAAAAHGVTVCGTRAVEAATAEHTWALLLGLARGIAVEDAAVRAGRWQTTVGRDLAGHTLGIIGLGRLGKRVARVARAFDLDVVAWSEHLTAEAAADAGVRHAATLPDLLRHSEFLTIHTRLSDRTRGLLGAAELALLPPRALLVNTSRGPIVDEAALVAALHSGHLGGAALDVFDPEPLPAGSPLRTAPNLLLTPHLGYVTEATYRAYFTDAVEDIEAWLARAPLRQLH